ncbi:MAG: glycosyltransferase, partial [Salinisphaera sp.]|nr:glycosyltransferase [Salinisphaera sp.]
MTDCSTTDAPSRQLRSPRRIALIFKRLDARGGAEVMGRVLLRLFTGLGRELTVIARKGRVPAGVRFLRIDPFHLGRIGRHTGFARAARRACVKLAPDLIYSREHVPGCHIYHAGGGAHAEMLHQTRRVEPRWKRTLDRWHTYHRGRLRLERQMYASGELRAVICNSAMVRDDIAGRFGLPGTMLHVLENGIDTAYYQRGADADARRAALRAKLAVGDDALVLLFVGSGFHRKGLAVAIRALALAQAPAHLVVVGRDRQRRRFQRQAARHGLAQRVHFVGGQADVR